MPVAADLLKSEKFYYVKLCPDGCYQLTNDLFNRQFSFLQKELFTLNSRDCVLADDYAVHQKALSYCLKNPLLKKSFTVRMLKPDANYVLTEWEFSACTNENGLVDGIEGVGFAHSGTVFDKLGFEIQLQSLKLLSDSSSDGILLLGRNYKILAYNKPAEKLSVELHQKEYVRGDDFVKYIRPEAELHFHRQFDSALRGNITDEVFELEKDDERLFLKVQMTPVYDDTNGVSAVAVVTKDVTALQNLSSRLNEITAMQSHQVRRPVANMLSLVNLFDNNNLNNEQKEYLHLLKISIAQLEEEIQSIVKKARNA